MNVTLFGGGFDPPHLGHQQVIKELLQNGITDAVWLVPVQQHPFGKQVTSATDRVQMLNLVVAATLEEEAAGTWGSKSGRVGQLPDAPSGSRQILHGQATQVLPIRVESYELNHSGPSYAFLTLQALAQQYPQHHFSWVIGSDNLASFHRWYKFQEMLSVFPFYVYPRKGFSLQPLYPGMQPLVTMPEVEVSSTQVREYLQAGQPITGLVDPRVEQYIKEHCLYR